MRRPLVWVAVALATLATATGCSDPGAIKAQTKAKASPTPSHSKPTRASVVMILGDSYTTGKSGERPEQTYAAETARILNWQVIIAGYRGTGFVAKGHVGKTFATLYREQLSWRPTPDMIIVSGGHNDRGHPPTKVASAARTLLTSIEHRWPKPPLVLMGPLWGSGHPSRKVRLTRDALKGVATELSIPFIDPMREQWITGDRDKGTGNAAAYILPDHTHPTPKGTHYIAERLAKDLRRLHLAQPHDIRR